MIVSARTRDGRKLHLQQGPIDLIVTADGSEAGIESAFGHAEAVFDGVLEQLVAELSQLRRPISALPVVTGPVAARMLAACDGYHGEFITPMAAVAGAVADHVVGGVIERCGTALLSRLTVNNGGDVAFWLRPGCSTVIGIVAPDDGSRIIGRFSVTSADDVRGVATSGWRGRSMSLGIADSVTVLAADAATADAAATLIGNAVDLPDHPSVRRVPAVDLDEASDLGARLVTVDVGDLSAEARRMALSSGTEVAQRLVSSRRISAALMVLGDQWSIVGCGPDRPAVGHSPRLSGRLTRPLPVASSACRSVAS